MITGRIKEQYKLENGKSVMPTPIEEQLALSPGVSQVMLYGADHPSNVALVAIDAAQVRTWAHEQGVPVSGDLAAVPAVHDLIATELGRLAAGFRGYEPPRAFVLTCDPFSSDNGRRSSSGGATWSRATVGSSTRTTMAARCRPARRLGARRPAPSVPRPERL